MEEKISYDGREYVGVSFQLGNVPLLIIKAKKGYVACGYVSKEASEKFGDVAAFVTGVKTFEDMFRAKIKPEHAASRSKAPALVAPSLS